MMVSVSRLAGAVAPLLLCLPTALAGTGFSYTCANYYLGNGVSDSTGELFIEAWCHGGAEPDGIPRPGRCTRLSLARCFKNNDGELEALDGNEQAYSDVPANCDIESCAIRGDAWNGPVMSCYCQDLAGRWNLASIDLDQYVGNEGGYLMCGAILGEETCLDPWASASGAELR